MWYFILGFKIHELEGIECKIKEEKHVYILIIINGVFWMMVYSNG